MAKRDITRERPEILLYHHPGGEGGLLVHICAGIEEEGVPYRRESREGGDAVSLAYQAAQESRLGVGIGLDAQGRAALHFERMEPAHPLFTLTGREAGRVHFARNLGSNAARLVKGVPFKPWEETEVEEQTATAAVPGESDRDLIRRIVEAVLAQGEGARR